MPRRGLANPEHPDATVHQGIPDPLGRGLAGGAMLPPELGPELLDPFADRVLVPGVILVIQVPYLPPSPVQLLGNCPARPGDACPLRCVEAGVDPLREVIAQMGVPLSNPGRVGRDQVRRTVQCSPPWRRRLLSVVDQAVETQSGFEGPPLFMPSDIEAGRAGPGQRSLSRVIPAPPGQRPHHALSEWTTARN
jgi:hypothetical protein